MTENPVGKEDCPLLRIAQGVAFLAIGARHSVLELGRGCGRGHLNRQHPRESRVRGADLLGLWNPFTPVAISFHETSRFGTLVPEQLIGVSFSLTLFYGMNCLWYVQIPLSRLSIR